MIIDRSRRALVCRTAEEHAIADVFLAVEKIANVVHEVLRAVTDHCREDISLIDAVSGSWVDESTAQATIESIHRLSVIIDDGQSEILKIRRGF